MAFHKTLPLDVFRHILSFKDPTRQVGVRGGIQTASARMLPPYVEPLSGEVAPDATVMTRREVATCRGRRAILYIWDLEDAVSTPLHPDMIDGVRRAGFDQYDMTMIIEGLRGPWRDTIAREFHMGSESLERTNLSELCLHCEACGPDLELYDMLR